jgi:hypothetical protein
MVKLHELPSTKVVMGVKLPPPPPEIVSFTNADLFRLADYGLYAFHEKKNEYVYSSIEYNDQFPETLNRAQINYLTALFEGVDDYIKTNPLLNKSTHRITKAVRQKTIKLGKHYKSHYERLNNLDLPESLKKSCTKLILFVLELVETFHFFDGMITDIRKIPNRPSDGNLRVLVHEIILDYQHKNKTKKFPTHSYILNTLSKNQPQLKLSARQYFNYKLWLRRGTYYWYIQP